MAKQHCHRVDASCVVRSAVKKNMDCLLLLRSVKADWEGKPLRFVQYVSKYCFETFHSNEHLDLTVCHPCAEMNSDLTTPRVQRNKRSSQNSNTVECGVGTTTGTTEGSFNFATPRVQRRKQCQGNDDAMPRLSPIKEHGCVESYTILSSVGVKL
jgi:protein-arginine kinase activator protein McsA